MSSPIIYLETRSNYCLNYCNKIKEIHSNSKVIRKSDIKNEIFEQNGIKYLIKFLYRDEIKNKEIQIIKKEKDRSKDPFEPPIEEGILIDEDFTESHRLVFNKFPIVNYHSILATKQNLDQYTHLNLSDLSSLSLLIRIINGYGFFNGGMNAGASQPHKHLQAIPYELNKNYGLFLLAKDDNNLDFIQHLSNSDASFCKLKIFDFNHLLIKFSNEVLEKILNITNENYIEIGNILLELYFKGLNYLELKNDPIKITKDYSFMLTEEWMLLVPRKTYEVDLNNGKLNLNSACYTLTIMVKTEELKSELKSINLTEVFKKLTV